MYFGENILIILFGILPVCSGHAEVFLSSGWHGRVQVKYSGQLGTICDDYWDDNDCMVVCRQLGHSGGRVVTEASRVYGEGTGEIWLDDVNCNGLENYIDECGHDFWGTSNCIHKEDAGCMCDKPGAQTLSSTCDPRLHRLREFDPVHYPGIGRVEIRKDPTSTNWQTICDDRWNDAGAHVFCKCVGYTNPAEARAYWSSKASTLPALPILYESVQCDVHTSSGNLQDCTTEPSTGRCGTDEAAFVACKPVPHSNAPAPPSVNMQCNNSQSLEVCFTSTDFTLAKEYMNLSQPCVKAVARNVSNGVCIDIDMKVCQASHIESNSSQKSYCYDILYSQFDTDPNTLLVDQVWTRRACCEVDKNGTVMSYFKSIIADHEPVSASAPTTFTLDCFLDETFSGAPLTYPANLGRGQDVFCRITAHTWDPAMYLVVPDCKVMASPIGSPSFTFYNDKCPTSTAIKLDYFSFDDHRWGFKFALPKFQGYHEVYLSCDTYICDFERDTKPYCDRSCHNGHSHKRRKRQAQSHDDVLIEVKRGPFVVEDSGIGPFIKASGEVTLITTQETQKPKGQHVFQQYRDEIKQKDKVLSSHYFTQSSASSYCHLCKIFIVFLISLLVQLM